MAQIGGFLLLALVSSCLATCPLGTNYESLYNKCYKYSANPVSFLSAEKACQTIGGSLVDVRNVYENTYISGFAAGNSPSPSFWIGANLLMDTQWTWSNGYNGSYMNWAPGQPSDPSAYQCAAMREVDNTWTKELCSTPKPYMCQVDPNANPVSDCTTTTSYPTATPTTPASPSTCSNCDPGYTLNPDVCKCYKLTYNPSSENTYNQSVASCQTENATLAIIRSATENSWIASFLKSQPGGGSNPLIGLLCPSPSHSSCKWQDGTSLGYSNFDPNKYYQESTVYINELYADGAWESFLNDGISHAVFCEKPAYSNRAVALARNSFNKEVQHVHGKPVANNTKPRLGTTDRIL